jgi:anaerobic selenocysteine-containing dehydrogenase
MPIVGAVLDLFPRAPVPVALASDPRRRVLAEGAVPVLRNRLPREGRHAGGKVVAVAGALEAEVNKGLLCVKGYHVGLALYGSGPAHHAAPAQGREARADLWDEAIDIIADRVEADPGASPFYGSGQWTIPEGYAARSS